jgi:hypothetical protein
VHLTGESERRDPPAVLSDGGPDRSGASLPPISRVGLGPTGVWRADGVACRALAPDSSGSVDQERLCGTGAEVEAEEHISHQLSAVDFFADTDGFTPSG